MAKKTISEVVSILKSDIEHNSKLLGKQLTPLAIVSANALAKRFKIGSVVLQNPIDVYKENPKALRTLATELYKHRVDYVDVLEKINDNPADNQNLEDLKANIQSPAITGLLARLIGYDLFMLSVLSGIYSKQIPIPVKIWKNMGKGNLNLCKKMIMEYEKNNDLTGTLYGGKTGTENFSLPLFCNEK